MQPLTALRCSLISNRGLRLGLVAAFWLAIIWLTASCNQNPEDQIPNIYVREEVFTNSLEAQRLSIYPYLIYHTGGVRGLIIYRPEININTFVVYDRNCTFNPLGTCGIVSLHNSGLYLWDSCCGSRFNMADGTVMGAPASRPLKQYYSQFYSPNRVLITN